MAGQKTNMVFSLVEFQSGVIKRVIRLNGNGKDSGGLSIEEEMKLVESLGLEFIKINIEGRDQAGLNRNVKKVVTLLNEGENLIHCKHGFDRTGAVVGKYLREMGFSFREIIKHNRWGGYEKKGKNYEKYFNAII